VAIFVQFDQTAEVNFNGIVYKSKTPTSQPVLSQMCIVFKDEWDRILKFVNFYQTKHNVDRFLLYDNNSADPPPQEILENPNIIYIPWHIPYKHTLKKLTNLQPDYVGPGEIITGQNSAYSHALKKFHTATWTLFLDTDEFIVRRSGNPPLKSILETIQPSTDTLILRGYWAGCNNYRKAEIYQNLHRIQRRSRNFCMNKLILRTSQHVFTDCVHRAYPTAGNAIMLAFERGIYFFHMHTVSKKRSGKCDCHTYCCHKDRSLIESWLH
jgi:hypothetical protein